MTKVAAIIFLSLSLQFAFGPGMGKGWAGIYLGEFCWELQATEDEWGLIPPRPPAVLILGITFLGGNHLQVGGRVLDPSSAVFPTSGTLEVLGTEVVGVFTSAGTTGTYDRKVTMAFIAFNLLNLHGIFWDMEVGFDALNRRFEPNSYSRGDMIPVACPGAEEKPSPSRE
jgi:hypothetical protein